jgi:hypothetical protein
MKVRALALTAALVTATGSAHAWFFFILPLGAIQNAVQGGHCVPTSAKAGDRMNIGGNEMVVKETNGISSRCSQFPNWPVIAKLEPYVAPLSEAELAADMQVCVSAGATAGSTHTVPGVGEVLIRSVSQSSTECGDLRAPVSARAVRKSHAASKMTEPTPTRVRAAEEPTPQVQPTSSAATSNVPSTTPAVLTQQPLKEPKSVVERLRELKQLRDENLITDAVYEAKQREILAGQ